MKELVALLTTFVATYKENTKKLEATKAAISTSKNKSSNPNSYNTLEANMMALKGLSEHAEIIIFSLESLDTFSVRTIEETKNFGFPFYLQDNKDAPAFAKIQDAVKLIQDFEKRNEVTGLVERIKVLETIKSDFELVAREKPQFRKQCEEEYTTYEKKKTSTTITSKAEIETYFDKIKASVNQILFETFDIREIPNSASTVPGEKKYKLIEFLEKKAKGKFKNDEDFKGAVTTLNNLMKEVGEKLNSKIDGLKDKTLVACEMYNEMHAETNRNQAAEMAVLFSIWEDFPSICDSLKEHEEKELTRQETQAPVWINEKLKEVQEELIQEEAKKQVPLHEIEKKLNGKIAAHSLLNDYKIISNSEKILTQTHDLESAESSTLENLLNEITACKALINSSKENQASSQLNNMMANFNELRAAFDNQASEEKTKEEVTEELISRLKVRATKSEDFSPIILNKALTSVLKGSAFSDAAVDAAAQLNKFIGHRSATQKRCLARIQTEQDKLESFKNNFQQFSNLEEKIRAEINERNKTENARKAVIAIQDKIGKLNFLEAATKAKFDLTRFETEAKQQMSQPLTGPDAVKQRSELLNNLLQEMSNFDFPRLENNIEGILGAALSAAALGVSPEYLAQQIAVEVQNIRENYAGLHRTYQQQYESCKREIQAANQPITLALAEQLHQENMQAAAIFKSKLKSEAIDAIRTIAQEKNQALETEGLRGVAKSTTTAYSAKLKAINQVHWTDLDEDGFSRIVEQAKQTLPKQHSKHLLDSEIDQLVQEEQQTLLNEMNTIYAGYKAEFNRKKSEYQAASLRQVITGLVSRTFNEDKDQLDLKCKAFNEAAASTNQPSADAISNFTILLKNKPVPDVVTKETFERLQAELAAASVCLDRTENEIANYLAALNHRIAEINASAWSDLTSDQINQRIANVIDEHFASGVRVNTYSQAEADQLKAALIAASLTPRISGKYEEKKREFHQLKEATVTKLNEINVDIFRKLNPLNRQVTEARALQAQVLTDWKASLIRSEIARKTAEIKAAKLAQIRTEQNKIPGILSQYKRLKLNKRLGRQALLSTALQHEEVQSHVSAIRNETHLADPAIYEQQYKDFEAALLKHEIAKEEPSLEDGGRSKTNAFRNLRNKTVTASITGSALRKITTLEGDFLRLAQDYEAEVASIDCVNWERDSVAASFVSEIQSSLDALGLGLSREDLNQAISADMIAADVDEVVAQNNRLARKKVQLENKAAEIRTVGGNYTSLRNEVTQLNEIGTTIRSRQKLAEKKKAILMQGEPVPDVDSPGEFTVTDIVNSKEFNNLITFLKQSADQEIANAQSKVSEATNRKPENERTKEDETAIEEAGQQVFKAQSIKTVLLDWIRTIYRAPANPGFDLSSHFARLKKIAPNQEEEITDFISKIESIKTDVKDTHDRAIRLRERIAAANAVLPFSEPVRKGLLARFLASEHTAILINKLLAHAKQSGKSDLIERWINVFSRINNLYELWEFINNPPADLTKRTGLRESTTKQLIKELAEELNRIIESEKRASIVRARLVYDVEIQAFPAKTSVFFEARNSLQARLVDVLDSPVIKRKLFIEMNQIRTTWESVSDQARLTRLQLVVTEVLRKVKPGQLSRQLEGFLEDYPIPDSIRTNQPAVLFYLEVKKLLSTVGTDRTDTVTTLLADLNLILNEMMMSEKDKLISMMNKVIGAYHKIRKSPYGSEGIIFGKGSELGNVLESFLRVKLNFSEKFVPHRIDAEDKLESIMPQLAVAVTRAAEQYSSQSLFRDLANQVQVILSRVKDLPEEKVKLQKAIFSIRRNTNFDDAASHARLVEVVRRTCQTLKAKGQEKSDFYQQLKQLDLPVLNAPFSTWYEKIKNGLLNHLNNESTERRDEIIVLLRALNDIASQKDNETVKFTQMKQALLNAYYDLRRSQYGSAGNGISVGDHLIGRLIEGTVEFFMAGSKLGDLLQSFLSEIGVKVPETDTFVPSKISQDVPTPVLLPATEFEWEYERVRKTLVEHPNPELANELVHIYGWKGTDAEGTDADKFIRLRTYLTQPNLGAFHLQQPDDGAGYDIEPQSSAQFYQLLRNKLHASKNKEIADQVWPVLDRIAGRRELPDEEKLEQMTSHVRQVVKQVKKQNKSAFVFFAEESTRVCDDLTAFLASHGYVPPRVVVAPEPASELNPEVPLNNPFADHGNEEDSPDYNPFNGLAGGAMPSNNPFADPGDEEGSVHEVESSDNDGQQYNPFAGYKRT